MTAGNRRVAAIQGVYLLASALVLAAVLAIFFLAPAEKTMGPVQRILYLHVAVAWFALAACLGMGVAALGYLATRRLAWDHWSCAAAETGWLAGTLTLLTGSLWARAAWNTWWTWEPRLTTVFLLWALYSAGLLIRRTVPEAHRAARLSAVLALVAMADLPLIVLATRWFRGMHPVAPAMPPVMRAVMGLAAAGFGIILLMLLVQRRSQLAAAHRLDLLESEVSDGESDCGLCRGLGGNRAVRGAAGVPPTPALATYREPGECLPAAPRPPGAGCLNLPAMPTAPDPSPARCSPPL